ncbi:MAG: Fic family protein [Oscillospiraceae bacterium]|nr:Fic family protein [Oscillospiraceae bacterium]
MDALKFSEMLSDKHITNLKKLKYKYPDDFEEFINILKSSFYEKLPLNDFDGKNLVYLTSCTGVNLEAVKLLFTAQNSVYAANAVEEEIVATSAIESIDFDRSSVRSIMLGNAPKDNQENRIYGLKLGFEFISNRHNHITEENIHKLYMMAIGNFLEGDDRLRDGEFYRHDDVYVVGGDGVVHRGIGSGKLPGYMKQFVDFANADDGINDLLKAAMLHFDIAYLHPYFDGNGRMARLLHMWFLIQKGYGSTLFVPMSSYIEKSGGKYYDAYTLVENNVRLAGVTDVTPFLIYFIKNVYDEMKPDAVKTDLTERYNEILRSGEVTVKEAKLWQFVLSTYGGEGFTTKQLEKDFGDAAFATVRKFALKFSEFGLLDAQKMKNKVIYRIK